MNQQNREGKTLASYTMFIGAMLIFGTIGIFRRFIPLSSGLLACARGFMGAFCLVIFVKMKGAKLAHGTKPGKILLLVLTGGMMGANWIFLFEAYNYTSVATATLCYYMQPTIVILLSPIIFGEKLTIRKLLCAGISIVGMGFVAGIMDGAKVDVLEAAETVEKGILTGVSATSEGSGILTGVSVASSGKGILFGLAAAALYAAVVIMNKKVQIEDAYEKTIIQLFSAAVILLPYLLLTEDFSGISLTPFSVGMLLVVGIIHTGLAYALYFASMGGLRAQSIAVLSYIDPVSALILSAVILNEGLSVFGMIGAVMIIGAALFSELGE